MNIQQKYNSWVFLIVFVGIFGGLGFVLKIGSFFIFPTVSYLHFDFSELVVLVPFFVLSLRYAFFTSIVIGLLKNCIYMGAYFENGFWVGHTLSIITSILLSILFVIYILILKKTKKLKSNKTMLLLYDFWAILFLVLIMTGFEILMNWSWAYIEYLKVLDIPGTIQSFYNIWYFFFAFNLIKFTILLVIIIFTFNYSALKILNNNLKLV